MLKQSANRNQRTKGFKVKQGFEIFTMIAVGIWLLYQLKHPHDKRSYEESSAKIFGNLKAGPEAKKLGIGRRGLEPWINKPLELMDDTEENEPERVKERSSGGDDDIVGHGGDKVEEEESEEVEDLIDVEDKEKEEQNEDEDGEDMGKQMEDMSLLEDQGHDEGEKDSQAANEKHNKETGASRVVMRVTKSLGSEFEFGGLRKVKEEEVENSKRVQQKKKIMDPSNSSPKVVDNVTIENGSFQMSYLQKE
ncbi:hypothetical protein E2542_SST03276 [Spatholobus suberectus]|nr:hypothetical protein E2542_SST03276 [Spatholobus suberectus]